MKVPVSAISVIGNFMGTISQGNPAVAVLTAFGAAMAASLYIANDFLKDEEKKAAVPQDADSVLFRFNDLPTVVSPVVDEQVRPVERTAHDRALLAHVDHAPDVAEMLVATPHNPNLVPNS
mgnify:CR=1 FL=1